MTFPLHLTQRLCEVFDFLFLFQGAMGPVLAVVSGLSLRIGERYEPVLVETFALVEIFQERKTQKPNSFKVRLLKLLDCFE